MLTAKLRENILLTITIQVNFPVILTKGILTASYLIYTIIQIFPTMLMASGPAIPAPTKTPAAMS